MDTTRIIRGTINSMGCTVTSAITQWDYGWQFIPEIEELPPTYRLDFSNEEKQGTALPVYCSTEGAEVPTELIDTGKDVWVWYVAIGDGYGITEYKWRIPNKCKPKTEQDEPTPSQQSSIDQLITRSNEAVETAEGKAEEADTSARNAKEDADRAERARTAAETAQGKAEDAQESAERAKDDAEASERNASESERKAKGYAETASEKADAITGLTAQATTLPDGSSATASYDAETGVMSFGIPKGKDGTDGDDGYSPTANVSKTGKVATITITDKNGTTSAQVSDGTDGTDGIDGVSPSVSVTDITGGHRIVITDKDGTKSFDVEDGATGATPNLTIGTVETLEPTDDATATITGTPENPVLNLGIPQGDTGEVTQAEFDELSDEVSDLKEDLSESLPHAKIIEFQNKTFSMSRGEITTDNPTRLISELLDIQGGDTFSMDSGYQYSVFRFNRQGTYLANPIMWASGDTQFTATFGYGDYLHRIYVRKNDTISAITADEIGITFDIASIDDTYFNVEGKIDNKYSGLLALKKEWKTAEQKTGTVTTGKFLKINGAEFSSDVWNYRTLNVNPGEQYAVSAYAGLDARLWLILSDSDTVLLYSADNSYVSLKTETITIPDGGAKLIVNTEVQSTAEINAILIEKIDTLNKIDERTVPANLLAGKVLCCVGDSITYGADMDSEGITNVPNITMYQCNNSGVFSEVTSRFRKTWGYQIAERNNMIFYNGGVSGSTMQGENGVNGFSLANGRYTKLPDTLDYLVIWFGWNDTAYGTLGTITDDTNATFYGGYNVVIPYLQNKYPYAKILLVVPYGADENHRNAIRQLGNKWGLAIWDNYQGGTPLYYGKEPSVGVKASVVTANQAKFQANGAHPNFKGHTQLADMIEAFLKTI